MRDYSVKLFNQGKDFVEISISAKNVIALFKKLAKNYPNLLKKYTFCQIYEEAIYINCQINSDIIDRYNK